VRLDGLALDEVGAEQLDRLWLRGGLPRAALRDLALDGLYVVHAGNRAWEMADGVRAVPAGEVLEVDWE